MRTSRRGGQVGPPWSRDGKSVLYVSDDGLWLANASTGKTTEIAHQIYPETAWNKVASTALSFYGQVPWSQRFSWNWVS